MRQATSLVEIFPGLGILINAVAASSTIEFTGTSTELDNYLKSLNSAFVVEIVRTGASGIGRGDRILKI